jgi:hypothetical protein
MIEQTAATRWLLACPECAEPVSIELPPDAEPGTGIGSCAGGHDFVFAYDGEAVMALGAAVRRG